MHIDKRPKKVAITKMLLRYIMMKLKIIALQITESLSVIIPAYNEEARILETLEGINKFFQENSINGEIIVVNDGSSDRTAQIVSTVKNSCWVPITYIFQNNRGKGSAVKKGMLASSSELRLFTDADGATDIYETFKLYSALKKANADGSIGSRALKDSVILTPQSLLRKITGSTLRTITNTTILPGTHDTQCGHKLFTKEFVKLIFPKLTIDGFSFDLELLYLARLYKQLIVEVPIVWEDKAGSKVDPFKESYRFIHTIGSLYKNRLQGIYGNLP